MCLSRLVWETHMVSLNSFYGVQLLVFQALLIHIFTQQHKRKSAAAGLLGIKYTHWGTYNSPQIHA